MMFLFLGSPHGSCAGPVSKSFCDASRGRSRLRQNHGLRGLQLHQHELVWEATKNFGESTRQQISIVRYLNSNCSPSREGAIHIWLICYLTLKFLDWFFQTWNSWMFLGGRQWRWYWRKRALVSVSVWREAKIRPWETDRSPSRKYLQASLLLVFLNLKNEMDILIRSSLAFGNQQTSKYPI